MLFKINIIIFVIAERNQFITKSMVNFAVNGNATEVIVRIMPAHVYIIGCKTNIRRITPGYWFPPKPR